MTRSGQTQGPAELPFELPEISRVEWRVLRVRLEPHARLGDHCIAEREYLWLEVADVDGVAGRAHGFTRGLPLHAHVPGQACELMSAPDRDSHSRRRSERLLFTGPDASSRRVASLLDLATIDLVGVRSREPATALLGAGAGSVPVIPVVGYMRDGAPDDLRDEVERAAARGATAVKLMAASSSPRNEVERLRHVVDWVGDMEVWLDVNGAWSPGDDTILAATELRQLGVTVLEEPYPSDASITALAELRERAGLSLAAGEFDADARIHRAYLSAGVDLLRADVTLLGVQAWLGLADSAVGAGARMFPHFFPEYHAVLCATIGNAAGVDLVPPWTTGLTELMHWEARDEGDRIALASAPGFGIHWDAELLAAYTAEMGSTTRAEPGRRMTP